MKPVKSKNKRYKKKNNKGYNDNSEHQLKVPLPRGNQTLGILVARLGGSRSQVRCLDGKTRVCRIPGRLKRALWVRPGDYLIVEPWEYGGDKKGDIIYKYRKVQMIWLKKRNYLKALESEDEF